MDGDDALVKQLRASLASGNPVVQGAAAEALLQARAARGGAADAAAAAQTVLLDAAAAGAAQLVEWLMRERGVAVSKEALAAAARGGHGPTLRLLLDRGEAATEPTGAAAGGGGPAGSSLLVALREAAAAQRPECVRVVLQRAGGEAAGQQLLCEAAAAGAGPQLRSLLACGLLELRRDAIAAAARGGQADALRVLLGTGCVPAEWVTAALLEAVVVRNAGCVRVLMQCPEGSAAAQHMVVEAAGAGSQQLLGWLLGEVGVAPSREAFAAAASSGQAGMLRLLLTHTTTWPGPVVLAAWAQQALCLAAAAENLDCMQVLLCESGAAMPGPEALAACARSRSAAGVQLLMQRGASLERDGGAALFEVAGCGDVGSVEWLLARGVPVGAQSSNGATALHAAVGAGSLEMARLLLAAGADPNAAAAEGDTPLHELGGFVRRNLHGAQPAVHRAAEARLLLVALLDAGADVNARGAVGRTPAHVLARVREVDLLRLLCDHGADFDAEDEDDSPGTVFDRLAESYEEDFDWEQDRHMEALHRRFQARLRSERDALAAELARERGGLPEGLQALIVGAAAEARAAAGRGARVGGGGGRRRGHCGGARGGCRRAPGGG
jgi:hypothetical protein